MSMPGRRITVLSIVGPGRSGTTLLARVLGEVPGIVDAGELYWTWLRGTLEQRPCGCGRSQGDCPVWSRVVPRALGMSGYATDDVEEAARGLMSCQAEVHRRRHLPRLVRGTGSASAEWPALRRLRTVTAALCRELADATGADVVVDASKRAGDAAILRGDPGIDLFVLQMVRDPRAVAHSWRRAKPRPSADGTATMATRRLPVSVERWTEMCVTAELLRRHLPEDRWHVLRYEDFVAEPAAAVRGILEFLGRPAASPVGPDGTVVLGTSHTVAGNPDRFRTGLVQISADDEWRSRMPVREQVLVGLLTAPLSKRYGYPVIPRSTTDRRG